ncbi:Catabolite control protein [uncultured Clostridium sp.]|nr:Catabolite control protein [uncultured Clostridium sp.]
MAVTVKEIARLAGVSRGTVDRALYNRGRVKPEVAERIRRIAKEQGYEPNRIGRALALTKKPIKIGVIVQSAQTSFIRMLIEGTQKAAEEVGNLGGEVLLREIDTMDAQRQIEMVDELVEAGIKGLALLPVDDNLLRRRLNELIAQNIPVVTFNADISGTKRLCFIGQDDRRSSHTAAGLMQVLLGGRGKVLVMTGHLSNLSHSRRAAYFMEELGRIAPEIRFLDLALTRDDDAVAYQTVLDAVAQHPDLAGIFIASNGQSGVCQALRELHLAGQVRVVCYDNTPENRENLREGALDFLLDQNSFEQGYQPVMTLFQYLFTGKKPLEEYFFTDVIIKTRYNI